METKLNLGREQELLSSKAIKEAQTLWDKLPTDDASADHHREYIKELNETRQSIGKVVKHFNRLFTIANTQLMKARMREHIETQMSILDFGIDVSKDQAKEEGQ